MVHFFTAFWIARYTTFMATSSLGSRLRLGGLADHAVQRFDGIGVDHLAELRWIIEQGDQVVPVVLLGLRDMQVSDIPGAGDPEAPSGVQ